VSIPVNESSEHTESAPSAGTPDGPPRGKTRVAILGGGPSALTAAYWLSSEPELREQYEITVYQMGWRLGGKGASGRGEHGRIEEHGLHLIFGFYDNFHTMMRRCYQALARPASHPLGRWRQAFKPRDIGTEEQHFRGKWHTWQIVFPGNGRVPGSGGALLGPLTYLGMALEIVVSVVFGWRAGYWLIRKLHPRDDAWEDQPDPPIESDDSRASRWTIGFVRWSVLQTTRFTRWARTRQRWIVAVARWLRGSGWQFVKRIAELNATAHRTWLTLDMVVAFTVGFLVDELLLPGNLERIDQYDFRDWLSRHGAHDDTLHTPMAMTIYDAAFSFVDGDPKRPSVAAGTCVRGLLRAALTYKGAVYYRMQAGMGDTVFAPLYLVLKQRGVKFEFFHRVEALELSEDRTRVERVRFVQQAELLDPRRGYEPLTTVQRLECWPAEPLYAQLEDGEALRGVDLESYYSRPVGETKWLHADSDFDKVLFGIPLGAVPYLCEELVDNEATPQWKQMVEHVRSVPTISFQLWLKRPLGELGWNKPEPLLSLFVDPFNTWADMSQVIPRESWPAALEPRAIEYYTGPGHGPTYAPPPGDDPGIDQKAKDECKEHALTYLRESITTLLPDAVDPRNPPGVAWGLLVDPRNGFGEERFDAQYWRKNGGPSERCTIALPGTNQYRMAAGATGYPNLFVTGDWTDDGSQLAYMEGTITSGILSARAVAGRRFPIVGEEFLGRIPHGRD
jgi:uncharacterized protein with NAD-binding domain and iron-sulfur cluster